MSYARVHCIYVLACVFTWQLERGHKKSICSIIGVYVYVAGRWAGLVMSYRLVSPHYTTTKAKNGGEA